jgi:hypothetical protein
MQPYANDNASPASPPEHYLWTVPGKPISIRLAYDVVDRLHLEVMQGFGSVPKRGAEVGGVLLGRATEGGTLDVVIDDYAPVHCEHRHGPSFLLSETDREQFAATVEKWRRKSGVARYVVGYYRSNTRSEFSLSDDDLALCETFLPGLSSVVLLIKPFATKACQAGFFFWEDGRIRMETPYGTFPFRRQDLGGGMPPKRTDPPAAPQPTGEPEAETSPGEASVESGLERGQRLFPVANREETQPAAAPIRALGRFAVASPGPSAIQERPAQTAPGRSPALSPLETLAPPRAKRGIPLPLAFVFLTLGVLLGFQAALQMRPASQAVPVEDSVRLGLRATEHGDNIQVNWNRDAAVVQVARHGVLVIWDGDARQSADLDAATLHSGNVVYRRITRTVRFRLEVFLPGGSTVSDTVDLRAP